MGKIYVVYIGHKPGVYATWVEANAQVNKFSGACHESFPTRENALKTFDDHIKKKEISCATSSASASGIPKQAEKKKKKLKDTLLDLAKITEDIKRQLESLEISDDES